MIRRWLVIGGVLVFLLLIMCSGGPYIIEGLAAIVIGWIRYLIRVLPNVTVNRAGVVTLVLCLALAAGMGQILCGWLWKATGQSGAWRARWTLIGLAMIAMMFAAGTAVVGVVHQTGWLINSPVSLLDSRYDRAAANRVKCASNMKQIGQALSTYAANNGGRYPARLDDPALAELIGSARTFVCPASNDEPASATTQEWIQHLSDPHRISYRYLPEGFSAKDPAMAVVLCEAMENHENGVNKAMNILFADGHVEFIEKAWLPATVTQPSTTQP